MLKDIVAAKALPGHRLWLRFEDGVTGELVLTSVVPLDGVFAPLADAAEFAKVRVNEEVGCVYWPNGADLDPDVLYALITTGERPDLTRGRAA
jgi:Protein of unknown function (DUF2442)